MTTTPHDNALGHATRPASGWKGGMKFLGHLLSLWLIMPTLLFACACLMMEHATARNTLFSFFEVIWSYIIILIPWGGMVILICLAMLAAAGGHAAWRRPAAGIVVALAWGSGAVTMWAAGWPEEAGQWWFYIPGFIATLISGWIILSSD